MRYLFLLLICFCFTGLRANNVRVVGNIQLPAGEMVSDDVARIKFTLEWENSWRDSYNHDAVYVVLKYRLRHESPVVWHQVYLQDSGHETSGGFTWTAARGAAAGKNMGVFIYRSMAGSGISRVNVDLKWNIAQTTPASGKGHVSSSTIYDDEVILACTGIEMVYIPRGAFALGDMVYTASAGQEASSRTFRQRDMYIPAAYDLVSNRYWIETNGAGEETKTAPLAANRVNDITNSTSNSWVGNGWDTQSWTIDFGRLADGTEISEAYTVKYISIESIPGHAPTAWTLQAAKNDTPGGWHTLLNNVTDAPWSTGLERVYPGTTAIKLTHDLDKYRYYRIKVEKSSMPKGALPVIKSVSMTDRDLERECDYSFIVDTTVVRLGGRRGLCAENDGETWPETTLGSVYPNGYRAFYVMKYEMSQEQYASFLQLLPPQAQQARTIGSELRNLPMGAYVFGSSPDEVNARNAIALATWNNEDSRDTASFACDMNREDPMGMDGDGLPLGCNYLTPADMLAYASWVGLRPLTELEYEKMSRAPFPSVTLAGSCAWGNRKVVIPGGLNNPGKSDESFDTGNVNFRSVVDGPARVGIFAKGTTDRETAGASFWGVLDLSGNLSEIYYNANSKGRTYNGTLHGNGVLPANGTANVSGWVNDPQAFGLRGGNFRSTSTGDLATSMRMYARGSISDINRRDSTVSFRLGYTCDEPDTPLENILTLENGLTTAEGSVCDTVCDGGDYVIEGNEPPGTYALHYLWYKSENKGRTWELLRDSGSIGRNLILSNLRNIGMDDHVLQEYWFRRKVVRDNNEGNSAVVKLRVVNPAYTISRYRDTINGYGTGAGIRVTAKYPTSYAWTYLGNGNTLTPDEETDLSSRYIPKKADMVLPDEGVLHGPKYVMVKLKVLGRCERSNIFEVDIVNTLDKSKMRVKDFGTYRAWADGSYAPSANAYLHPTGGYEYRGDIGSGIYRVDPDGRSGPIEPFDVYCDMETDGGGWSVIKVNFGEDVDHHGTESNTLIYTITYNLTQEQIVGLRAVSKTGYQYFSKKCYNSLASSDAHCSWHAYGYTSGSTLNFGHYYNWPNYDQCNPNDAVWRQAHGKVTDINLIPIWRYYGDETGDSGEYAKYTFGDVYFR